MKKDIRNLIFIGQPIIIILKDYTKYSKLCNYVEDIFNKSDHMVLKNLLEFMDVDTDFEMSEKLGWDKVDVDMSLIFATNHKIKPKEKTDGTWPISIKFIPPKIFK